MLYFWYILPLTMLHFFFLYKAAVVILSDANDTPLGITQKFPNARYRMTHAILTNCIERYQNTRDFRKLVLAIHKHVTKKSNKNDKETQQFDQEIKRLIVGDIIRKFNLENYCSTEGIEEDLSDYYSTLVDYCYKLSELERKKVKHSLRKEFNKYDTKDYEINEISALIAMAYTEFLVELVLPLFNHVEFMRFDALNFVCAVGSTLYIAQAAILHHNKAIKTIDLPLARLLDESSDLKRSVVSATGQALENLQSVCYSYSMKQILDYYDQRIGFEGKSNESILEAIKNADGKFPKSLQLKNIGVFTVCSELFCRNFTKYEMLKSYDGSVTAKNFVEWRLCMVNLESRIEQIKNTVFRPKRLDAQQKPNDAV